MYNKRKLRLIILELHRQRWKKRDLTQIILIQKQITTEQIAQFSSVGIFMFAILITALYRTKYRRKVSK